MLHCAIVQVGSKGDSARTYQGLNRATLLRSTQLSTVPPFKPIPPADGSTPLKPVTPTYIMAPVVAVQMNESGPVRHAVTGAMHIVPQFQSLPSSISRVKAPQAFRNALQQATSNFQVLYEKLKCNLQKTCEK